MEVSAPPFFVGGLCPWPGEVPPPPPKGLLEYPAWELKRYVIFLPVCGPT
jgi:hypothetical protein